jgi:hypothetical protein
MSYWGQFLGSWDTAAELLKEYQQHRDIIRPVTDRDKKGWYKFRDGRDKEITLSQLRHAAKKESE